MIISASRRTDIPTYYSDWFYNRIKEGFVYVRNPMNIHQISNISLSPDLVDGIVFWTKNPMPMISRLDELHDYIFYFQFTLNSYDKDIEPNVPSKQNIIIPAFKTLSKKIGKDKVIWRYDPILFNEKYDFNYHLKYFKLLARQLADYTEKCTVSFLDYYKNAERNIRPLNIFEPDTNQKIDLLNNFSTVAQESGIHIDTCAEDINFRNFGIKQAHCIDKDRFERIGKYNLILEKDKNQRVECGCVSSIDIGAYNTCKNGCLYCYANYSSNIVKKNNNAHDPKSPLLFGHIGNDDVVKIRHVQSCRDCQLKFV